MPTCFALPIELASLLIRKERPGECDGFAGVNGVS